MTQRITPAHVAPTRRAQTPGRLGRQRGPFGVAVCAVAWLAIATIVAVVAAGAIIPRLLGAVPLTVLTGSMRPGLQPGDLLVVRPVTSADGIEVGDVVTYQPVPDDPAVITHRVAAVTLRGGHVASLVTRGDANGADDPPIVPAQVQGTLLYSIPKVGWFASWMNAGKSWYAAIVIATVFGYAAYCWCRAGVDAARARRSP